MFFEVFQYFFIVFINFFYLPELDRDSAGPPGVAAHGEKVFKAALIGHHEAQGVDLVLVLLVGLGEPLIGRAVSPEVVVVDVDQVAHREEKDQSQEPDQPGQDLVHEQRDGQDPAVLGPRGQHTAGHDDAVHKRDPD